MSDIFPPAPLGSRDPAQHRAYLEALARAINADNLDGVLAAVLTYSEEVPPPPLGYRAPAIGLTSSVIEQRVGEDLSPDCALSWYHTLLYNAGNTCFRAGAIRLATEVYKHALLGYRHPSIFLNLGSALRELGHPLDALLWYRRALVQDPDYTPPYLAVALLAACDPSLNEDPARWLRDYWSNGGDMEGLELLWRTSREFERSAIAPYLEGVIDLSVPSSLPPNHPLPD